MTKKRIVTLSVCAVLLLCVLAAGCTGPSASPTPSAANNSSNTTVRSKAAASTLAVSPSASVTAVTPTPSAFPTTYGPPSAGGTAGFSVLYFTLAGCPHCAALESSPSFHQLQNEVSVTKIWSSDNQTNSQWGVSTYPTLILLKNGVEVQRFVGDEDATRILARINAGY